MLRLIHWQQWDLRLLYGICPSIALFQSLNGVERQLKENTDGIMVNRK